MERKEVDEEESDGRKKGKGKRRKKRQVMGGEGMGGRKGEK